MRRQSTGPGATTSTYGSNLFAIDRSYFNQAAGSVALLELDDQIDCGAELSPYRNLADTLST
jgi:hypothetical protein